MQERTFCSVFSQPPKPGAEIHPCWGYHVEPGDDTEIMVVPYWETLLGIYPLEFAGKLSSRKPILKEVSHWRCSTAQCSQCPPCTAGI